ncbi:permease [Salirhabdus sp. Marseille-P4669]|uniref:permease n=1 Tax=Salirhabdus sp. Marseille-P4669 TaxID=2042310 RepID=UPI000C79FD30|nr:permease [Salirhabdus sp. Marseille-P4669]
MLGEFVHSFILLALELIVLFIGISFLISILQSFIPYERIEESLKTKNKFLASWIAVFFAFITPFCSCSTIPVVVNMLKKKMPFGIVMVFLFASPVLDPTILTIMGVVLGWKVTIIYVAITSILSIVIGLALEAFGFEKSVKKVVMKNEEEEAKAFSIKNAWEETFTLMKEVLPFVLLGALIGAGIKNLVPTEWIAATLGEESIWLVPIAAILGIPLYIRLSSMIPISQVLLTKGMALGPVMALLISSAGASLPEVVMLKSIFKKELVILFVLSVFSMASISGFLFYLI